MIGITTKGDHKKTKDFLRRLSKGDIFAGLDQYGRIGVDALMQATPVDTGLTAQSWEYRIIKDSKRPGIEWYNTNIVSGVPIAVIIQYGHATGTGGYVIGKDYINPTMRPIFDQIAEAVWKEVTR